MQFVWQNGQPACALQVAGSLAKSLLKTVYYYIVAALYGAAGGFSQVGIAGLHCVRRGWSPQVAAAEVPSILIVTVSALPGWLLCRRQAL